MDRLRGLTGFVQRFSSGSGGIGSSNGGGVGDSASAGAGDAARRRDVLPHLPLTQAFLDQLPRKQIEQTAKDNEAKAAVALELLQCVDELVDSHTTTAASLTTFLTQLSTIPESLAQANALAQSIHNQLTTLSSLIATEESRLSTTSLTALQHDEDLKFSKYMCERNAVLEQKKAKYAQQLDEFRKERMRMIVAGEGGRGQDPAGDSANGVRLTALRGQPSRRQTPLSRVPTPAVGITGVAVGLEHVTLTEDTHGVERRDLDDFFDRGRDEGGGSAVSVQAVTTAVASPLKTQILPPELTPESTKPSAPVVSPPPRPLLEERSRPLPIATRAVSSSRNLPPPGVIAADEDFDAADSDAIASLYGKGKKSKKRKK